MWKDSIFCSHCPRPPLHILRFCVFFGKKEQPRVPGIRRQHKQDWGRKCSPLRTEYIEQSKRQRSGSKKVRRDGGDLSLSLRCCGDFLEAIYSPPSSSAPHLTALPKEPLGLCRLVVVSKCSGCRSLGKNGVIEIAAAKVRGWEDGRGETEAQRETLRLLERPPVLEFFPSALN